MGSLSQTNSNGSKPSPASTKITYTRPHPDLYPYPSEDERSPSPDPQINGPKRPRQSDGQNSPDLEHTIDLDHPKRSKVDEDWLRHSPAREAEEDGEEEIVEVVLEEKEEEEEKVEKERILSRYASEVVLEMLELFFNLQKFW